MLSSEWCHLSFRRRCEAVRTVSYHPCGYFRPFQLLLTRYVPSLNAQINAADLVIGHAGAGTCMEVLAARKPMITVINPALMDNHQAELATRLAQDRHLIMCDGVEAFRDGLTDSLTQLQQLRPLPPPTDGRVFRGAISNLLTT